MTVFLDSISCQNFCFTPPTSSNMSYNSSIINSSNFNGNSFGTKTLRVYYHVITRTDGSGGYTSTQVDESLEVLQNDFNLHGIYFSWDGCIDYIKDDNFYFGDPESNAIFNVNNHMDGIDIYLYPENKLTSGGSANGVGESSEFWISGSVGIGNPVGLSRIISHEMGHVLFLFHTHHGTDENEQGESCKELVNESNSAWCGDYVVETPADPNINYAVDENCVWTGTGTDENGHVYKPDGKQIMSYSTSTCFQHFVPGQAQRMHMAITLLPYLQNCLLDEPLVKNLCECVPDDKNVLEDEEINEPYYSNGNITIKEGATLTISDSLYMGQDKTITIESGGKLLLNGVGCVLDKCDAISKWTGIIVQNGGTLEVVNATIHNALNAIHAEHKSTLNIETAKIYGQSKTLGSGIFIDGDVTIPNFNHVTIEDYKEGIIAYNGAHNVYNFNGGKIHNTLSAITFIMNTLLINDYEITNTGYGIMINNGPSSTIHNCSIGYTEYGVLANWSPFTMVDYTTIGIPGQIGKVGMSMYQSGNSIIYNNPLIQATYLGMRLWSSQTIVAYNNINTFGTNNEYGGGVLMIESPNSVMEQNYLDINQSAFGIETNLSNNTHIFNNQIDHFSSIATRTAAIRSMGSMDETINNNIINGVANTTGIIAQNSTSNQYLCNIIDNTHEGLGVYYNAEMQNIRGNEIDAWTDLAIRSQVGPQVHHGNKFVGGKARADELDVNQILGSQFLVNSSIPYLMPTDILPSSDWFINQANANAYTCTGTQGPSWTPFNGGGETEVCAYWTYLKSIRTAKPEMFFVKLYHLLKYAKTKPGFVLPGCVKQDPVFLSVCGITKLMDVGIALHKMGTLPVNASNLNTLQVQFGLQTTDAGRASLKNQIQTELALVLPILDTKAAADTIKLDSITTELNTINCTSVIVSKWKDIFKLYVKYLKTGEVAVADRPTLMAYSSECADIYGDAIHMARAMANTYDNSYFDAYDVCITPTTPRSITTSEVAAISVHPNPTSGILYLNLPNNYTGHVAVRDIDGKAIIHQEIKSSNLTSLDLTMYNGVYFIVFTSETGDQSVHKVILIK